MNNQNKAHKAQKQVGVTPKMEVVIPESNKVKTGLQDSAEDVQVLPVVNEVKAVTIEDLKRKAEQLTLLAEKYDGLVSNLRRMENFALSHDHNTAEIKVRDSKGETFTSHSPDAIQKFLEICKSEYTSKIAETETKMREIA